MSNYSLEERVTLEHQARTRVSDTGVFRIYPEETVRLFTIAADPSRLPTLNSRQAQDILNSTFEPNGILGTAAFIVRQLLDTPEYLIEKIALTVSIGERPKIAEEAGLAKYHLQYGPDATPFFVNADSTDTNPPLVSSVVTDSSIASTEMGEQEIEDYALATFKNILAQAAAMLVANSATETQDNFVITVQLEELVEQEDFSLDREFQILIMNSVGATFHASGILKLNDEY